MEIEMEMGMGMKMEKNERIELRNKWITDCVFGLRTIYLVYIRLMMKYGYIVDHNICLGYTYLRKLIHISRGERTKFGDDAGHLDSKFWLKRCQWGF